MRFSQLVALSSCFGLVVSAPQTQVSKRQSSPFLWFGVNESCAEFGQGTYPGELGVEYTWPDQATMQTLRNRGMNMFRVAFSMERLVPNQLTGPPDAAYMADLRRTVNWITSTGAYAVLDPHNYGRYYGNIITSTANFGAFWTTVAREFASNNLVVFDTNNEYHTMDQTLVVNLNQAAINAIRAAGATSQYIFVEGNQWSGAWSWVDVNTSMGSLTDPQNRLIYEMHQYLDSDSSGTNSACVSATIGEERVRSATQWLRSNGKRGILGEFAGANNQVCQQAVRGLLAYLAANSDVWTGALWWAAGPWWANYMYSIEPPTGPAYSPYMPILEPYFNSAGVPPVSSTSTSQPTSTTTSRPPTTTTTSRPSTTPTTTRTPTSTPTATVPRWGQCGGQGWTGPTTCASPYTCECQNQWYCQCL